MRETENIEISKIEDNNYSIPIHDIYYYLLSDSWKYPYIVINSFDYPDSFVIGFDGNLDYGLKIYGMDNCIHSVRKYKDITSADSILLHTSYDSIIDELELVYCLTL